MDHRNGIVEVVAVDWETAQALDADGNTETIKLRGVKL